MDQQAPSLELLDAKLDEVKAMLIELLTWKSELEVGLKEMQSGGILAMVSKMFKPPAQ